MADQRKSPPEDPKRRKNNVQVSARRNKFVYVDLTKHLLFNGEPFVEVSALGSAINEAVGVVETLKKQEMVIVTNIETSHGSRGDSPGRDERDKISITVKKAPNFEANYRQYMEERESRRNTRGRREESPSGSDEGDEEEYHQGS